MSRIFANVRQRSRGPRRTATTPVPRPAAAARVGRLVTAPRVQAKLRIGAPDDAYEREADRVADRVMRMPEPAVQRTCAACEQEQVQRQPLEEEEEMLQTKPRLQRMCAECEEEQLRRQPVEEEEEVQAKELPGQVPALDRGLEGRLQALRGGGRPLAATERAFFEPRFGADFATVRLHTGGEAAQLARAVSARAFTVGREVVLGAGEYAPASAAGRRLLAHELTHVVQQSGRASAVQQAGRPAAGPLVQRTLSCAIDHVKDECNKAGATCQTVQDSYCKKKYPKPADIDTLHANAVTGAKGKKKDIPHAADNLLHFLGASGSEKVMPVAIFKNHSATKDQLKDVHREKFKEGAEKRLKDGRLTAGGSAEMVWTDTASAFTLSIDDLGLAVGGYTLCSKVEVSAKAKSGGDVEVSFDKWSVQAFDCYNWDPGKGIGSLFGGVTDNDLCCLENAGKGKHFRIRTDPWTNTGATGSFTIAAAAPKKKKPPPPAKPDGDR